MIREPKRVPDGNVYKMGGRFLTGRQVNLIALSQGKINPDILCKKFKLRRVFVDYLQAGAHAKYYRVPESWGKAGLWRQQQSNK